MKAVSSFIKRHIAWINFINIILLAGWATVIAVKGWFVYLPCNLLVLFEPMTCRQAEEPNLLIYAPIPLLIIAISIGVISMIRTNIFIRTTAIIALALILNILAINYIAILMLLLFLS